ncbi:uncharacterized protein LOC133202137 [Saccostrea echinata]|uniref:uncharacterized protein LOC133202137 n=1 Tax=Saccostrea echinata TaxID=191078 RepID=UPI002A841D69|nr:uncharacterized protein LOC133202137 [Saccostrea echinata]
MRWITRNNTIDMAESGRSFLYTYEQDRTCKKANLNQAQVAKEDDSPSKDSKHSATKDKERSTEDSDTSSNRVFGLLDGGSFSNENTTASNFNQSTQAQVPIVHYSHSTGSKQLTAEDNERKPENCDTNSEKGSNLLYVRSSSSECSTASKSPKSQEKSSAMEVSRNVYCSIPKEDKYKCSITCITALEDGELVVYDEVNFKLKVFDSSGYYIGSIENIYNCRDITAVDSKQFAITQEGKELLTIFLMRGIPKNPKGKQISLPGKGYHCKYGRQHYAVTCDVSDDRSRCLIIMDAKERQVFKKIPNISVAQMEIDPNHDVVYVSDTKNKTLTCINFQGDQVWFRKLDWAPYGLCVVADDFLFVSSTDKQTIFKFQFRAELWEECADFKCTRLLCYNAKKRIMYATIQRDETEVVNSVHILKINKKKLIKK